MSISRHLENSTSCEKRVDLNSKETHEEYEDEDYEEHKNNECQEINGENFEEIEREDPTTSGGTQNRLDPKVDVRTLITEGMTRDLQEFLDLCKSIKAAKEELKILSDRKMELETGIQEFMIEHEIPAFKTPSGLIQIRQTKSIKPLNKDFLRETISTRISDTQMALELTELAFSNRPTTLIPKIKVSSIPHKV